LGDSRFTDEAGIGLALADTLMRSEWDRLGDNRSGIGLGAAEELYSNWDTPGSLMRLE